VASARASNAAGLAGLRSSLSKEGLTGSDGSFRGGARSGGGGKGRGGSREAVSWVMAGSWAPNAPKIPEDTRRIEHLEFGKMFLCHFPHKKRQFGVGCTIY